MLIERPLRGEHKVLMETEMVDDDVFHSAYRMTPATFDQFLDVIAPHITKQVTTFRDPVGVAERLGITLRYVEQGSHSFYDMCVQVFFLIQFCPIALVNIIYLMVTLV